MKSNALDMIIDLLDDFDQTEVLPFDAYTLQKLEKLGFDQETIEEAYAWFHESCDYEEMEVVNEPSAKAVRIYHPEEILGLSAHSRSLIMKLEQVGALTVSTREMIINQMLQLDIDEMDIDQLKWLSIIALTDHLDEPMMTWLLDYLFLHRTDEGQMEVN